MPECGSWHPRIGRPNRPLISRQTLSRRSAAVAALAAALVSATASQAAGREPLPEQSLRAASALLIDARTGEVLLARRPDEQRAIASATKLMTALLALERAQPRDLFTAPPYRAAPAESKINLRAGERIRLGDLLKALLLESANDAAVTIAEGLEPSRGAFVREMNRRARELGLRRTRFSNPIGLDDPGNHSSARDLAKLARLLMAKPAFARIADLPEAVLRSGARRRLVRNRNRLVARHPFVDGVKTGHTARAGYVLVGSATGRGVRVISVVLGEPSETARDADSVALLHHGIDRLAAERAIARLARRLLVVTPDPAPGAGPLRRLTSGLGTALALLAVAIGVLALALGTLRMRAVRRRRNRPVRPARGQEPSR